jgi:hypothetical protein
MSDEPAPQGQLLIYNDGGLKLQVRLDCQTVWLTQAQMAELYQTSKQNISLHIQNILDDNELPSAAVVKEYLTTAADSKNYRTLHYSLDMILAVGYRVRSPRGTLFRQWATTRLRELLIKGFTLDDERIKAGRTIGPTTSTNCSPGSVTSGPANACSIRRSLTSMRPASTTMLMPSSPNSFSRPCKTRCIGARTHRRRDRASARRRRQAEHGLVDVEELSGRPVRKGDVAIAKNYLNKDEIEALNLIVSAYLDFAELQARSGKPMHMADWIAKLDDFLRLSERDIIAHAGRVSHREAEEHSHAQYELFERQRRELEAASASDFDAAAKRLSEQAPLPPTRRRRKKKAGDEGEDDV